MPWLGGDVSVVEDATYATVPRRAPEAEGRAGDLGPREVMGDLDRPPMIDKAEVFTGRFPRGDQLR